MVNCSIEGCSSRIGRDKISFFAIPAVLTRQCELTMELSERRRKIWFERIYNPGFDEKDAPRYVRVCANHFVNGKPSALFDVANADWAPCINLGRSCNLGKSQQKPSSAKKRRGKSAKTEPLGNVKSDQSHISQVENSPSDESSLTGNPEQVLNSGIAIQTDITCDGFSRLEDMYKQLLEENIALRREVVSLKSLLGTPDNAYEMANEIDAEGPSLGLEKVEVILKAEPDLDLTELDYEDNSQPLNLHKDAGRDEESPCNGATSSHLKIVRFSRPSFRGNQRTDALAESTQDQDYMEDRNSGSESEQPEDKRPKRTSSPQKRAKKFPCTECGQKFISKQALEIHVRIHTGERPFECEICQRGFSVASTLKAHMRTHTGERPFACDMCSRRFSEHGTLKCHMRTHTGEKPYECDVCHKKFSENSTLRRHLLTHTGERPFECETCHSKFIQKYNLNNHIRRVHIGTTLGL